MVPIAQAAETNGSTAARVKAAPTADLCHRIMRPILQLSGIVTRRV